MLLSKIKEVSKKFTELTKDKEIFIISHFDTDGITSATIMIKTLKKLDKRFSLKIIKNLEEQHINNLPQDKIILFLDLASGSLDYIEKSPLKDIFIIDHHEISREKNLPENIHIVNPAILDNQKMSASCLTYLFCKELFPQIKEFSKLAILGMIGDCLEKEIDKLNSGIFNDSEITRKRGLLVYPSTRPINRTLEYSSSPFIPEVTGNIKGTLELLREININPVNGKYPSILELDEEQMSKLVTAIMLRNPKAKNFEIVGDIFLLKMFNKLEDARELSAMINACSRLGEPHVAIQVCLEIPKAKKRAETIHAKYKQLIISGLKFVSETQKIEGKGFVIINAGENIKDTMAGTITSILSNSSIYEEGTIITTLALDKISGKIKISSRNAKRTGRNVREILSKIILKTGGDVGGHKFAAGAMIETEKEEEFINLLKKNLEIEIVKI